MEAPDQRLERMDAAIQRLSIRCSAQEWILRQLAANAALADPEGAGAMLENLKHGGGLPVHVGPGSTGEPTFELVDELHAEIDRLVSRIQKAVASGA